MRRIIRHLLAVGGLLALPAAAQPAPPPSLVVLITVDQLRLDYLSRWESELQGGLGRLYREGAVFTRAFQDHGITETAPGHASLLSGRFPRSTGIVRNIAGVQDPRSPIIGGGPAGGASPFRFRGSTLIDWMRLADPRSRALSVSRKDRGAILPLGRAHESVFWYALDGRFSSSRYYMDTLPGWVAGFNAERRVHALAGRAWEPLLPAASYPEKDSVPAENGGREVTFPHRLPSDSAGLMDAVMVSPWMDQITLDLAMRGVQAMNLGGGPATDLLAVSLSSTDAVGHRYGPDSREIHDQVLRLDRMLGVFLDSLLALRGPNRVVIALSSDHGVTRYPEVADPGRAASYFVPRAPLTTRLKELVRAAGLDTASFEFDDGVVFYDRARLDGRGVDVERLLEPFVAAARLLPGVQRADLYSALAGDTAISVVARRWTHMFPPDVGVAAVVTLAPGHLFGTSARSAQHGAPHDDDAQVPIILYGPGFSAGRYSGFARTVDLAPTLAERLGVMPTEPLDGRVLREALLQTQ